MRRLDVFIALAGLGACRLGGPRANPDDYVSFPDAATDVFVSVTPPEGDDGGGSPPEKDAGGGPSDDGGATSGDDGGGFGGSDAAGCSPMVAVCDPVHNTGCNPLQQCDVNPLQAGVPTGQCVFGMDAGGACTASIFSESCLPGSTCVDAGCRLLCFCDTDCPTGQCCSDRSGPPGFTLCRPCP